METLLGNDRLGRNGMAPRILLRGLGVMALVSAITVLGTGVGNTRDGHGRKSSISTQQVRASADRELAATARDINRASVGETRVASFLGAEFGMSQEAIITQKKDLGASWGNLTIAHTLVASNTQGMTVAHLLQLLDRGMGWGQIAAGLRFELNDAVRAVNAEGRVATGRAKADGKAAPIRGDGL
jgi:hypothetical protein